MLLDADSDWSAINQSMVYYMTARKIAGPSYNMYSKTKPCAYAMRYISSREAIEVQHSLIKINLLYSELGSFRSSVTLLPLQNKLYLDVARNCRLSSDSINITLIKISVAIIQKLRKKNEIEQSEKSWAEGGCQSRLIKTTRLRRSPYCKSKAAYR